MYMPNGNRFPDDLSKHPLSHREATRELLSWENIGTVHIVEYNWMAGEQYVTEVVVSTRDGDTYRASWNGKRQEWAIGKLIRNPDAAKEKW